MNPNPINISNPQLPPLPPDGQQPLAGMQYESLLDGSTLSFSILPTTGVMVFASAFDKRQPCRFQLESENKEWGHLLDVSYCSLGQRFHVPVPPGVGRVQVQALDGDRVFHVLADEERLPDSVPRMWPVVQGIDRVERFFTRLENDCVAEFGWMGGCVLEAFESLASGHEKQRWLGARDLWLAHFLDREHLRYQNRIGEETVDAFVDSETLLPLASIARLHPEHPIMAVAVDFFVSRACHEATCEGCYTLAYPLLQIAMLLGRNDLVELARRELVHRREHLFHDGAIYLRHHGTHRTYRNWARGVGWYLLGHAECIELAGSSGQWSPLAEHLAERARWVLEQQRADGLWSNFFYEPELPPDTAGSAGIAAALVKTHTLGLVGDEAVEAARRCWEALTRHLFVDGWLGWTSPSNKRGEAPQHRPQLASETFGMGLMGRLGGEIHRLGRLKEFN